LAAIEKAAMSPEEQNSGDQNKWVYLAAATQFTTAPIAGGAVGYAVDYYFKTGQIFTAIGFFLGFFAGIINLVRLVRPNRPQ
jgi:F0F1-type ATP synthase assembly protein I